MEASLAQAHPAGEDGTDHSFFSLSDPSAVPL